MSQLIESRSRLGAAVCLTILAGLFSWLPTAEAQTNQPAPRPVSFSVVGGLNIARLSLPALAFDEIDIGVDVDLDSTSRLGLIGGLLVEVPLSPKVTFDTGALLSTRGSGLKVTVTGIGTLEGDLRMLYLDVPAQVRLPVARSGSTVLHVLAGATIGARLHARSHVSFAGQTQDESFTSDVAPVDFGLTVGGRVDVGHALFIAQYVHGLIDTTEGDAPEAVRHRVFSVMAGWRF